MGLWGEGQMGGKEYSLEITQFWGYEWWVRDSAGKGRRAHTLGKTVRLYYIFKIIVQINGPALRNLY